NGGLGTGTPLSGTVRRSALESKARVPHACTGPGCLVVHHLCVYDIPIHRTAARIQYPGGTKDVSYTKEIVVIERQLVIDLYPTRMGNLYLYVGIPLLGESCLQKRISCSPVIRYLRHPGLYRFRLDISKAGFDHPAEKHVNLGSPVGCFPPFRPGAVGNPQPTSDTHLGIPLA